MCTVTYIPSGKDIFLTANRDEKMERPSALMPDIYRINEKNVLFPKDISGGGTWFAINENGNSLVFLNGAFENHIHQPPYRKSRGLVLLDLATTASPATAFDLADLDQIAPFTAIITEEGNLYICRWDGSSRSRSKLNAQLPHIWSSVTLYDPLAIEKRRQWFGAWLSIHPEPSFEDVMHFHRETGEGDPLNDLLINRDNGLFTHSISLAHISGTFARFYYLDLRNMKTSRCSINFLKAIPAST